MDCKAFRQEIEALNAGETPGAAAQAHLDSCLACRTFQSERLSLRQLMGSLGAVNAPPDFDFRLRARLAAVKDTGNYPLHRTRFAPGLKAISVAATFALLITAALAYRQFQPVPPSAPATHEQAATATGEHEPPSPATSNKPEQLAVASPGKESAPVVSHADSSDAREVSPDSNGAARMTRAKDARRAAPPRAERSPIISNDLALRGNPVVLTPARPSATTPVSDTADAATLLQVSSQPVRILLHDRQGAMRSVSLERVVFGSQSFMERNAQGRRPVAADAEGIW